MKKGYVTTIKKWVTLNTKVLLLWIKTDINFDKVGESWYFCPKIKWFSRYEKKFHKLVTMKGLGNLVSQTFFFRILSHLYENNLAKNSNRFDYLKENLIWIDVSPSPISRGTEQKKQVYSLQQSIFLKQNPPWLSTNSHDLPHMSTTIQPWWPNG